MIAPISNPADAAALLALMDTAVKSAALLALAAVGSLLLRKSSAAARHALWCGALAGALMLPVLSFMLPEWRVPWLPSVQLGAEEQRNKGAEGWGTLNAQLLTFNAQVKPPETNTTSPSSATSPTQPETQNSKLETPSLSVESWALNVERSPESLPPSSFHTPPFTLHTFLWVWLAGSFFALLPLLAGCWQAARLARRARRLDDAKWNALFDEVAGKLNLRRKVRLLAVGPGPSLRGAGLGITPGALRLGDSIMPFTWGAWRAVVVFPENAEAWPEARRRLVLLHELGHVKRQDWLTQTLGTLACALYWFNPLAWLAARQLRLERELACDDLVLRCGSSPRDYARDLLEIAANSARGRLLNWVAVPVARHSKLETRLRAILDGTRNRRGLTRAAVFGLVSLVAVVVIPMAMLHGAAAEPATSPVNSAAQPAPSSSAPEARPDSPATSTATLAPTGQVLVPWGWPPSSRASATPAPTPQVFSLDGHPAGIVVRSSDMWLGELDGAGVAPSLALAAANLTTAALGAVPDLEIASSGEGPAPELVAISSPSAPAPATLPVAPAAAPADTVAAPVAQSVLVNIPLKTAKAEDVVQMLRKLEDAKELKETPTWIKPTFSADPATNSVNATLVDRRSIFSILKAIAGMDPSVQVPQDDILYITLKNANAADVAKQLTEVDKATQKSDLGKIPSTRDYRSFIDYDTTFAADARTNSLLVVVDPRISSDVREEIVRVDPADADVIEPALAPMVASDVFATQSFPVSDGTLIRILGYPTDYTHAEIEQHLRDFVRAIIDFPQGAGFAYTPGEIHVTNTTQNLKELADFLEKFAESVPQIEVSAQLLEVPAGQTLPREVYEAGHTMQAINEVIQQPDTHLLSAPKVTVFSGKEAAISVEQTLRYPTKFAVPVMAPPDQPAPDAPSPITPGTPMEFATIPIGTSIRVTPTLTGNMVAYDLHATIRNFWGFSEVASGSIPAGQIAALTNSLEMATGGNAVLGQTVVIPLDDIVGHEPVPPTRTVSSSRGSAEVIVPGKSDLKPPDSYLFITFTLVPPGGAHKPVASPGAPTP